MLEHKQSYTLDYLKRYSIRDIKVENTKVILIRGDGEEYSINTTGVIDGVAVKGPQGPVGDKGSQGESAYDIAVRLKKTNKTVDKWLASLTGDKGFTGSQGKSGRRGKDGKDAVAPRINFERLEWLYPDQEPYISFNRTSNYNYSLKIGVPGGAQGQPGKDGIQNNISAGTYTIGKEGVVTLDNNVLNITVPSAITGEPGRDSRGLNAFAPSLDITVDYTGYDQEASVRTKGEPVLGSSWTKEIVFTVPRGETGDKGPRGEQGADKPVPNSPAVLKIISDIKEIQDPGKGFCIIAIDNLAGFQGKAYGYSWRTDISTFQAVNFVDTINGFRSGWWYRTGPAVGNVDKSITEGWKRCKDR